LGWIWLAIGFAIGIWWLFHLPSAGYGGLALAMGATLMPLVWEKVGVLCKMGWIAMLFVLLAVEYRAIDEDRRRSTDELTKKFGEVSAQANQNLKQILADENRNFGNLLNSENERFATTIRTIVESQREDKRQFASLLKQQQALFEHEDALAAALNGKLVPANDPIPDTYCRSPLPSNSVLVMIGDESQHNASLVSRFPHTVYANEFGPVVSIDRSTDGSIAVLLDIRTSDKKLVARLNRDGFVVNRNNYLEMKHDKSTLQIIDEYGDEVLYVRYNNGQTISVRGVLHYADRTVTIGLPKNMKYFCSEGKGMGSTDYYIGR
jgi:hypothetical protein